MWLRWNEKNAPRMLGEMKSLSGGFPSIPRIAPGVAPRIVLFTLLKSWDAIPRMEFRIPRIECRIPRAAPRIPRNSPAILRFAAALAALILRLQPAGCDLESPKHHKYRGGLGLRFSNRSGLRPVAI